VLVGQLLGRAPLETLCAAVAEEQVLKPGWFSLFANIQTAIAAIDAVLAETITAAGVAS
jgi:hypothetical protein